MQKIFSDFLGKLALPPVPPKQKHSYSRFKLLKSSEKVDYLLAFIQIFSILISTFHGGNALLQWDPQELRKFLVFSGLLVPLSFNAHSIRGSVPYTYISQIPLWGMTLTLVAAEGELAKAEFLDPLIIVLVATDFSLVNSTLCWHSFSLTTVARFGVILTAKLWVRGASYLFMQLLFFFFELACMHLLFAFKEEIHVREAFFRQQTINNVNDSLHQTLDSLPEPLAVTQDEEIVYCNERFTATMKGGESSPVQGKEFLERCEVTIVPKQGEQDESVPLKKTYAWAFMKQAEQKFKEHAEAPHEKTSIAVKENKFEHSTHRVCWGGREALVHLFVNITAAHDLTLAAAANRYQKIMFSSVTHELRTPLNSSINALDLLEGNVPEEFEQYLRVAKTSNKLLLALVEDILDLTRLEGGRFSLNTAFFKLGKVAELVHELFCFQVEARGLRFEVYMTRCVGELRIFSDSRRIEQVLLNLVSNALKFTQRGSITLVIDQMEEYVRFAVRDTGIGISE